MSSQMWDVIVVGGGLIGSSAAYQLARRGMRTLLVEKGDLASGASGANFGNIQVQDAEFGLSLELSLLSYEMLACLEDELDCPLDYRKTGSVLLIENERQLATMKQRAARLHAAGVASQLLNCNEICDLEPGLAPESVIGGLYHDREGELNPFKLVHAYARRGREFGLDVQTHTQVTGVSAHNGRVAGVDTDAGYLSSEWVVLAAGAWAKGLARTASSAEAEPLCSALLWVHGEALVTEPVARLTTNSISSASFFEQTEDSEGQAVGFCMRQRPEGNVMIGEAALVTEELGRSVTATSLPAIVREAQRRYPALQQASVVRSWAIPVAFLPDNRPLLGPVDGIDGLLIATGLKSTIILTPLVGGFVADMVTGEDIDPRLAEFSPSRAMPSE